MFYCPYCGAEVNGLFCPQCGAQFTEDGQPVAPADLTAENPYAYGNQPNDPNAGVEAVDPGFWGGYAACWRKCCVMKGRASRGEYWGFNLINYAILVICCLFMFDFSAVTTSPGQDADPVAAALSEYADAETAETENGETQSFADAFKEALLADFGNDAEKIEVRMPVLILVCLYSLAIFLPSFCVTIRRFHDQDRSGWFILLSLIPKLGGLIVAIFMLLAPTQGPNRFGPLPMKRR